MIETEYLRGRKPEVLVHALKAKGITKVVDVRDSPAYPLYYRPGSFAALCRANGIEYDHAKDLGNPKSNRVANERNPAKMRDEYLKLLREEAPRARRLEGLRQEFHRRPDGLCLVCMCDAQDELGCHRFWLKALVESGT